MVQEYLALCSKGCGCDRKSQKGIRGKDDENRPMPHTDVKGGFDVQPIAGKDALVLCQTNTCR